MLKVNEKFLCESLTELKQCDQELHNQIEQIDKTRFELCSNSSLKEEMLKLSRILSRVEMIQHNIKSMVRVLDYASFEYKRCENDIVSHCNQTLVDGRSSLRLEKVVFNVPFSEYIGWKKGVQNGSKL